MAIKLRLDKVAQPIFTKMAKEAGVGVADLAEIACYNLIALYIKDNGEEIAPNVLAPFANSPSQPHHPVV